MSDKDNPIEPDQSSNTPESVRVETSKKALSNPENLSVLAKRFLWADSVSSVNRVISYLGILCAFLFILDFIVHRHAYAPAEGLPGFYAIVGFIAFTFIVLAASQLRRLILRKENYYSPNNVDAEPYPEGELERLNHALDVDEPEYSKLQEDTFKGSDSDAQALLYKDPDQGESA